MNWTPPHDYYSLQEFHHDNGQLAERGLGHIDDYSHGNFMTYEGKWEQWYENGQVKGYESYQDGMLNGEWKSWYENGHPQTREFYRNNECEGEHKKWYENGRLQMQEFYRNGKLEGERKLWHPDGRLDRKFYRNGELVDKISQNRRRFIRIKKYLQTSRILLTFANTLIPDLSAIITSFIPS